jgi:hypothetical protein
VSQFLPQVLYVPFIAWYEKRAEARYGRQNQRASARFLSQTPISIGDIGLQDSLQDSRGFCIVWGGSYSINNNPKWIGGLQS